MYSETVIRIAKIMARQFVADVDQVIDVPTKNGVIKMRVWEAHFPYVAQLILKALPGAPEDAYYSFEVEWREMISRCLGSIEAQPLWDEPELEEDE